MKKEDILSILPDISDEQAEEILKLYSESVSKLSKELEAAKNSSVSEEALSEAYERGINDAKQEFSAAEFERLLAEGVENAGSKSTAALRALLDMEKIKLKDGKLEGFIEQLEALKNECGFLFEEESGKPKFTSESYKGNENVDFSKLSYKERLKLYKENPELYKTFVR